MAIMYKIGIVFLVSVAAIVQGAPTPQPVVGECVTSCAGISNGVYQSCLGCDIYAHCRDGILHDRFQCPPGKTYDDTAKQCVWWSSTCGVAQNNGTCISSCLGVPDGPYQSCNGCDMYVECVEDIRYDFFMCYPGTLWDDSAKECLETSTTCPAPELPDGFNWSSEESDSSSDESSRSSEQSREGSRSHKNSRHSSRSESREYSHGDSHSDSQSYEYSSSSERSGSSSDSSVESRESGEHQGSDNHSQTNEDGSSVEADSDESQADHSCESDDDTESDNNSHTDGGAGSGEADGCVSSCADMEDGDYQSCYRCDGFVKCAGGRYFDFDCPAPLVWDDAGKICLWQSSTCNVDGAATENPDYSNEDQQREDDWEYSVDDDDDQEQETKIITWNSQEENQGKVDGNSYEEEVFLYTPDVGECVSSCEGVATGIYQSCNGCYEYVECVDESIIDNLPCPLGTVYDDTAKQCIWWSSTCGVTPNNGTCISTCLGVDNGDYQSCFGCEYYVTCSEQLRYDERLCLAGLRWDDNAKRCVRYSSTCTIESDEGAHPGGGDEGNQDEQQTLDPTLKQK